MRICIVVNEFFGWGKFGGFGSAARLLATELASQGVDVSVVTPRRAGQPPVETVAGVTIYSYPVRSVGSQLAAYRTCDADIYHSQEATVSTYVAMRAMPDSYHVVTCRYTRTLKDLLLEMKAYVQERPAQADGRSPVREQPIRIRSRAAGSESAMFGPFPHSCRPAEIRPRRPSRIRPKPSSGAYGESGESKATHRVFPGALG